MYGDGLPTFGYTAAGWQNGQSTQNNLAGITFATDAGSQPAVGLYSVYASDGTLTGAAAGNYDIGYTAASFQVVPRPIIVTADAQQRIYGDANPPLTYSVGGNGLVSGDTLSGTLTTAANGASGVGAYAITQGTLTDAANTNYAITYLGANLAVTVRPITVAADDETMAAGGVEPPLTWQITAGSLVNGDQISGALTRQAGQAPGAYAILQGSLATTANYAMTYLPGVFTITPGTTPQPPSPPEPSPQPSLIPSALEIMLLTALEPPGAFVQTSASAPQVWTAGGTGSGGNDDEGTGAGCVGGAGGAGCAGLPFPTNMTYGTSLSFRARP